mmetsp:Transcript_8068/g.19162  ORF Transcript_8068/g.19162 Transcript_8068/m.19162 type:complete len:1324 (+) Transcript_8068:208-4179(+)|eukprot:CAMPEP_0182577092 /NCGR_PEP_ID=MMETSP1324-20130603/36185_1 /TAXON_ID=236786 /ORGANISM="Florenciella sp., Strain RCC1587" /LENGTH=1323 /DNA_ID=CAMNT_0024792863 /DNA_START=126 /DNA_END=4097 /DNA_ORIENTATION=+
MSSGRQDYKALINWYVRNGLYRHAYDECSRLQAKRGAESHILFWKAVSAGLGGSSAEAIRDLHDLRPKRDAELPALMALMHFHEKQQQIDHDEVDALRTSLNLCEDSANDAAVVMAATFCLHIGDFDSARRFSSRVLPDAGANHLTPVQMQASVVAGWVEIMSAGEGGPGANGNTIMAYLGDSSLDRDLEAIMARARFHEACKNYDASLDQLNQAIALQSWYVPALLEKAKVMMSTKDWDQALDMTSRVLNTEHDNLFALRIVAFCTATRQSSPTELDDQLMRLIRSMDKYEPGNGLLYCNTAKLFARLSGRKQDVLRHTTGLLEKALRLEQDSSVFHTEMGYQQTLMGNLQAAMDSYQRGSQLDDTNVMALHGMIHCQILMGDYDDAEQQLEFFKAIHDDDGPGSPMMTFLDGLLAWRKNVDANRQSELLDVTLSEHLNQAFGLSKPMTVEEQMTMFNPEFMLEIAKEFLQHTPSNPDKNASSTPPPGVVKGLDVLNKVVSMVPGLVEAHLMTAKANFGINQLEVAQRTVNRCLELDPSYSDGHLLLAQIALTQQNHRLANQSLEQALSYNFQIRSSPIYHLVRAQVLSEQGDSDLALAQLEEAMELPGIRVSSESVSVVQRADIFVEMANVLGKLSRVSEAQAIVAEARSLFKGTTAEVKVIVADSELAIRRNDFDSAIKMLNKVPQDSPAYGQAQMVKANIFLTHRHDKRAYTKCYRDLVEMDPSPRSCVLLGEAYMRIQAPEAAVEAFHNALKLDPGDTALAAKIGRALVSTHDYRKAIDYYMAALKSMPENMELRFDLAKLLAKLRKFEQAIKCLRVDPDDQIDWSDLGNAIQRVSTLSLLAEIHKDSRENPEAERDTLMLAKSVQVKVLDRMRTGLEGPEMLEKQKTILATICRKLAIYQETIAKDDGAAVQAYKEALRAHATNETCMLALCKLHYRRDDYAACRQQCEVLCRVNKDNEDAAILIADLEFAQGNDEEAMSEYMKVLKRKPNNYNALKKLIVLLKRSGKLTDAPKYLKLAERNNARAFSHAGLHFCKGLYHRSSDDIHEAVKHFNLGRRDGEWGRECLTNMVEVYLNPDNDNTWDAESDGNTGQAEAVKIAGKLMDELEAMTPTPHPVGFRVLQTYSLLGEYKISGNKEQLDRAEQQFIEMLEEDREFVPAMLGLSNVFMFEKAQNKARNMLKRIAKMQHSQDLCDEFESAYLNLADIYILRSKYDLALDLCRRCLQFNKSCGKAWEYMGVVMEREQAYKDAAEYYEQAWKCAHETSAPVGYRLAFNYLKAKRYVEAIDVCHRVLRQFPDYPKINSDILEKAYSMIRP